MPKKTRDTSYTVPARYRGVYLPTGETLLVDFGEHLFLKERSSIEWDDSGRQGPNSCVHKVTLGFTTSLQPYTYHDPAPNEHTLSVALGFIPVNGLSMHAEWRPTSYAGWESNMADAWEAVRPSLGQGAPSLPNFLFELGDVRRMFDLWSSRRSVLKNFANGHLNFSFGWAPFLSDVKRIVAIVQSAVKRYQDFIAGATHVHKRHFQRKLERATKEDYVFDGVGPTSANYGYTQYNMPEQPVYRFTVEYCYTISQGPLEALRGLLDGLGVGLNPRVIWEAIPYSFVVDWFFRVGDMLNRLRQDNIDVNVEILNCCHSIKWETTTQSYWKLGDGAPAGIYSTYDKEYLRYLCDPTGSAFDIQPGDYGPGQWALTVSLLVTRPWVGLRYGIRRAIRSLARRKRRIMNSAWRLSRHPIRALFS